MNSTADNYVRAYKLLNKEQRLAVDQLEGPILIVAGPGTGKTQLLTTRIGRILETTDSAAQNILCLTFSDSAARTMQERLAYMIGSAAYDVTIATYHSFGSDLLQRYPELFLQKDDLSPADDLIIDRLLREICGQLSYQNHLKSPSYIKDIKSLISGYKRAQITPMMLEQICQDNKDFMIKAAQIVNQYLVPGEKIKQSQRAAYQAIAADTIKLPAQAPDGLTALKSIWQDSLTAAIEETIVSNKMTSLSKWKAKWLAVSRDGLFELPSLRVINNQLAMAQIYETYNQQLIKHSLYDYDDMILMAIEGLKTNPDIKLTLQERYQYILLDEFQDTNVAQFNLVELLTDNPINEGKPNILAVGDDDQAVYRFQGAHYSHMERFYNSYRDVSLINLKINYRSTPGIIALSSAIRNQIKDSLKLVPKLSESSNPELKETILRVDLPLNTEHLAWTANYIKQLIKDGTQAEDIAILSPKHTKLAAIIPYLHSLDIPINYQQKNDILSDDLIDQLLTSAKLVVDLSQKGDLANSLWPKVLSYEPWGISTSLLWELSWLANDSHQSWSDIVISHPLLKPIALFFIRLSLIAEYTSFDLMLSYLIGNQPLIINDPELKQLSSPFYNYYFSTLSEQTTSINANEWRLLGHLSILQSTIKSLSEEGLNLIQFVAYIKDYEAANLKIIDKSPFQESNSAVNLLTAFSSKGSEYSTIILLDTVDQAWGHTARSRPPKIGLPINLLHVRLDNNDDDEKLRLLFVAVSRAKHSLVMVGYKDEIAGKKTFPLSFLDEHIIEDNLISPYLPKNSQIVTTEAANTSNLVDVKTAWFNKHLDVFKPERSAILKNRLAGFKLTATNLNYYTDVEKGGPIKFYLDNILKFPSPPSISSQFGTSIHNLLHWQFNQTKKIGQPPLINQVIEEYALQLKRRKLAKQDFEQLLERGTSCLKSYLAQTKLVNANNDLSEQAFEANYKQARLKGSIDRLIINETNKTLQIVDFKTGKSYEKFGNNIKSLHHQRQLYFYKLLIELNPKFKAYTVTTGTIQFVEPDKDSGLINSVSLVFDQAESDKLCQLISLVWDHIMCLNFPNTDLYPKKINGVLAFEQYLLEQTTNIIL